MFINQCQRPQFVFSKIRINLKWNQTSSCIHPRVRAQTSPAGLWGTKLRHFKRAGTLAPPRVWAKNGRGGFTEASKVTQSQAEQRWEFSALGMSAWEVTGLNKLWYRALPQTLLRHPDFSKGFPVVLLNLPNLHVHAPFHHAWWSDAMIKHPLGCIILKPAPQHLSVMNRAILPTALWFVKQQKPC